MQGDVAAERGECREEVLHVAVRVEDAGGGGLEHGDGRADVGLECGGFGRRDEVRRYRYTFGVGVQLFEFLECVSGRVYGVSGMKGLEL